jgi:hypothetical protein
MAVEWFCQLMGSELGPFSASQIVDMARKRQITPEDMIKKGRDGEWVPAYRVKGLFEAASRPVPAQAKDRAGQPAPEEEPDTAGAETIAAAYRPVKRMWFYISSGRKHGPMPFETLRECAATGRIQPTDRVWSNTCPKWSQAKDVDGLDLM